MYSERRKEMAIQNISMKWQYASMTMGFTNTAFLTTQLPNLVCIEWFYLNCHLQDLFANESSNVFLHFVDFIFGIRPELFAACVYCLNGVIDQRSLLAAEHRLQCFRPKSIKKQERNSSINKCFYCAEYSVFRPNAYAQNEKNRRTVVVIVDKYQ